MLDVRQLTAALDLWLCMWEPEEQERYETAVVRAMTDANPRATRLQALALACAVATPRLRAAARKLRESGVFAVDEIIAVEVAAAPWRELVEAGERLRGNVLGVELFLARWVANPNDRDADAALDWVDVRDLVAVARTTLDARLFGEIERRIARRGKYQRARAAHLLGFPVRAEPERAGSPIFGD